jgi:hypothetical protein
LGGMMSERVEEEDEVDGCDDGEEEYVEEDGG